MHNRYYKIAILLPNLDNPGGLTTSVFATFIALRSMGHEVHLFPVGKTLLSSKPFIHNIDTNDKKKQLKEFSKQFQTLNMKKPFDIVISNNLRTNKIVNKLGLQNTLMVFHNSRIIQRKNSLNDIIQQIRFQKIYRNQNIAFVSHCFKDAFLSKFNSIKPRSMHVIYNPVSQEYLQEKAMEEVTLPPEPYIICVGRIVKEKNQEMIIKALKTLEDTSLHLVILGDGSSYKRHLEHLVHSLGLEERVHFLGWKNNPYPYIKHAKLLISVSKSEAMPMTLIESLALCTPVVSTDIRCGPSEILRGKLQNYLVPQNDIKALQQAILHACKHYPTINKHSIEPFDINTIASQFIHVIEEILAQEK